MFMQTFMSNGNGLVIINNPPPKTDSDNLDLLASRVSLIMEMKHTGEGASTMSIYAMNIKLT